MIPKSPPLVNFFATSRLAHAYRSVARHSKRLTNCATIQEFPHARMKLRASNVVLSHADDDGRWLTRLGIETVASAAFHMLFTEPTTHPDQVARWMRTTNVRSENRLHVVKVESLEVPELAQLLGRVCLSLAPGETRGNIVDAYLVGGSLQVRGPMHRMLHVPVRSLATLADQPQSVLRNFTIDPDGSFLHWPDLDAHLGWSQFLQAVVPEELRKAQQRTVGFNERYGAAIRKVREAVGLPQSMIAGLTERQLRRIEFGECRATSRAIAALAKAHGLGANAYLERLAKVMM